MKPINAFLRAIAYAEGTDKPGQHTKNKGYDVIVGGSLMDDYKDHPRKLVKLPKYGISSTAAGRYQILARYFDVYKIQLGLRDFSPDSQDAIAIQLIKECKALADIDAGRIEEAFRKCSSRWASLPGSKYGQRTESMEKLLDVYYAALAS
ncbi:Phage lysozyme [compost metagenome]